MPPPWTEALARMHGRIARTAASVTDGFPHFADPATGTWTTSPGGDWTGGFWNGMLWLAARYGEDPRSRTWAARWTARSEEHTSELQSHLNLVCRLLLEKKKKIEPSKHTMTGEHS